MLANLAAGWPARPSPVQAAEVAVRTAWGLVHPDAVALVSTTSGAGGSGEERDVVLTTPVGDRRVRVDRGSLPSRRVSCGGDPADPRSWLVTEIVPA